MSDKLGPLHFGKREAEVFLGRDFGDAGKEYSEQTAIEIDSEVRTIVTANYDRAKKIVMENLDKLKALAEALLEYETVDGADIDVIFAGNRLERKPAVPAAAAAHAAARAAQKDKEKAERPSIFAPPRPVSDKA
jgi:cell division protease FtsH